MFVKNIKGEKYINQKPYFDFKEYFTGELYSWGIVQNNAGEIINRFDLNMLGSWENDKGKLEENFLYYDGRKEHRVWNISVEKDNNLTAMAHNIIGKAKFKSFGNAIRWQYLMDVPVGNKIYRLHFNDWMWLMNDNTVVNRSYMSKFGFQVGEITIFIKK